MMRFDTDNIDLLPFSSNTHLMHHLGYLFRTDRAQKWTNRHTDQNRIIMNDSLYAVGSTLESRKATEKMMRDLIRELKTDYKHLYMCRIECPDDRVYYFDDSLFREASDIIRGLDEDLAKLDKKILFAVTHEDQTREFLHFHLLIFEER